MDFTSVAEVRAALELVREHLTAGLADLDRAAQLLDEAGSMLADLSRNHQESLVPPELARAGEELQQAEQAVRVAVTVVLEYSARL
ncbi:MAG TPA: hypothetical protein VIL00_10105 [Pseudonocardiaceae bacterium]